ncbi:MAG: thiamine pyrophosphate-dependent enzyme [Hyphomicrobiaceae bacterium]|nr:thiamine pyrophosphate-dependent enzyme [Hyphomicrobiaceae bacterium]
MSKAPERSAGPRYTLDRITAVPALVGNADDFLIVAGLAGTAKDMAAMSRDGANYYGLAGAMGAAVSMGLGLALARPDKKVLVATGDGELLMNIGSLATVSVLNPPNLRILCVDNGHYGETGYQKSHTCLGVDLEQMAIGAGIKATCSVESEADIAKGAKMLRESNGSCFVLLRVKPTDGPKFKRSLDPAAKRVQFRLGTLGQV